MDELNQPNEQVRKSTLEIILALIGAINCFAVPIIYAFSAQTNPPSNFFSLFELPTPGLYFIELVLIGVLGLLAGIKKQHQPSVFWSVIPWISSGILLTFVILGAWTIGFFLIPAMIAFLVLGILVDRRLKGEIALHVIYFVSAGIAQAVIVFIFV